MSSRIGSLYVYLDDESIMSWFKARASGQRGAVEEGKKEYAKQIISTVKEDLHKMGFIQVEIKFNRKLGCSCGCSPGFEIKAAGHRKDLAVMHEIMCITPPAEKRKFLVYRFEKGKLTRTARVIEHTVQRTRVGSRLIGGKRVKTKDPYSYSYWDSYSAQALKVLNLPEEQTIATTKDFIR